MNIKNIKALVEKDVYPKWHADRGFDNYLFEDKEEQDQCLPYNSYPIPKSENLIVMISDYSTIKIFAEMTELGHMMYSVKVNFTIQDTVEKEFHSPFLDDALAEALIALKESSDEKKKMMDEQSQVAGHPLE